MNICSFSISGDKFNTYGRPDDFCDSLRMSIDGELNNFLKYETSALEQNVLCSGG